MGAVAYLPLGQVQIVFGGNRGWFPNEPTNMVRNQHGYGCYTSFFCLHPPVPSPISYGMSVCQADNFT